MIAKAVRNLGLALALVLWAGGAAYAQDEGTPPAEDAAGEVAADLTAPADQPVPADEAEPGPAEDADPAEETASDPQAEPATEEPAVEAGAPAEDATPVEDETPAEVAASEDAADADSAEPVVDAVDAAAPAASESPYAACAALDGEAQEGCRAEIIEAACGASESEGYAGCLAELDAAHAAASGPLDPYAACADLEGEAQEGCRAEAVEAACGAADSEGYESCLAALDAAHAAANAPVSPYAACAEREGEAFDACRADIVTAQCGALENGALEVCENELDAAHQDALAAAMEPEQEAASGGVRWDAAVSVLNRGGPVMYILLGLSVLGLAIAVVKLGQFTFLGVGSHRYAPRIVDMARRGESEAALAELARRRGPIARVLEAGVRGRAMSGAREEIVREEVQRIAQSKLDGLERGLPLLSLIATVSPLLGLLGTVLGMIEAFQRLEGASDRVDPAILSGGIWEALLTTAGGLAVAIPAAALYTWLQRTVDVAGERMEDAAARIFTVDLFDADDRA